MVNETKSYSDPFYSPENEKRGNQRVELELEASLTRRATQTGRTKNRVFTRDFSSEGAYLRADTALGVDEPVELQLPLPSTNRLEAGGYCQVM